MTACPERLHLTRTLVKLARDIETLHDLIESADDLGIPEPPELLVQLEAALLTMRMVEHAARIHVLFHGCAAEDILAA